MGVLLSRRAALGALGAAAIGTPVAIAEDIYKPNPKLVDYWNMRAGVLHTLQRPYIGTGNVMLLSDSRGRIRAMDTNRRQQTPQLFVGRVQYPRHAALRSAYGR